MGVRYIVPMAIGLCVASNTFGAPGDTELVTSSATTGTATGGFVMAASPDARFVVFNTDATDVLPGGNPPGLFVKDRLTGAVELVSVSSRGVPATSGGNDAGISANGRYVVFSSYDANLVAGDTNDTSDIFLRDRVTRQTTRLSVSAAGAQGNGPADVVWITPDGRFVLFESDATTLVPGDTNLAPDVFVRDLQLGTLQRVSLTSTGGQVDDWSLNASISSNGRYVAFQSWAANVVPGDTNRAPDIFVRDRSTGLVERVSVRSNGAQATGGSWPASQGAYISADGRFVAFNSFATDLVPGDTNDAGDVFVHDRATGVTERVNLSSTEAQSNDDAWVDALSADGRYVLFESAATNLVSGDLNGQSDVFVRDRQAGTTARANVSSLGVQANGSSFGGFISADGRLVTFSSEATNLVDNDENIEFDGYVHEMGGGTSSVPFVLETASLEFGKRTLNTARTFQVILSNTSGAVLPVEGIRTVGVDATQFTIAHDCGTALAAGSACGIRVTFRPTSIGPKTAQVRVTAGANVVRSITLSGTGVPAVLAVTPDALAFGTVAVGTVSALQVVTIRNAGEAAVPIRWIALDGPDADDFRKQRACPAMLAPGRACRAFVTFAPASKGAQSARLVVSPGTSGARHFVTLTGNGG
jgi:Tol biopolymer transport system component